MTHSCLLNKFSESRGKLFQMFLVTTVSTEACERCIRTACWTMFIADFLYLVTNPILEFRLQLKAFVVLHQLLKIGFDTNSERFCICHKTKQFESNLMSFQTQFCYSTFNLSPWECLQVKLSPCIVVQQSALNWKTLCRRWWDVGDAKWLRLDSRAIFNSHFINLWLRLIRFNLFHFLHSS